MCDINKKQETLSTDVMWRDIEGGVTDEYGVIYSPDGKRLLSGKKIKITEYTTKEGVEVICIGAFSECRSLVSINVGSGVTTIGERAFELCTGLTSVTISDSVTEIGRSAFLKCSGLTSVNIPDSVTSIGNGAFLGCSGLTSVIIPNSVRYLSGFPFCTGLAGELKIPNSVTSIGIGAFQGCTGLTKFKVSKDNPRYCDVEGVLFSKDMTTLVMFPLASSLLPSYVIPDSVTIIGCYAFIDCEGLTSVNIPDSVTRIEERAFEDCTGLTSIDIPDSVTTIGDHAFSRCEDLTEITIPNSVTEIGYSAFAHCKSLTSVTIPNSVTTIGEEAFWHCSSLKKFISLSLDPPICGKEVFSNVPISECILYVPKGAKEAYASAYTWQNFTNIIEME